MPSRRATATASDGRQEIAFDIDLVVFDAAGTELLRQPNFVALVHQAHGRPREFVANMTVKMSGAPAGGYKLEFVFHDRHGGGTASFTTEVTLQ